MAEAARRPTLARRIGLVLAVAATAVLMISFLSLVAGSAVPLRGARVFGRIANQIKGNPGATAYVCLVGGMLLWLVVGMLVAIQEWRGKQRRTL